MTDDEEEDAINNIINSYTSTSEQTDTCISNSNTSADNIILSSQQLDIVILIKCTSLYCKIGNRIFEYRTKRFVEI
jgi:hypothetical protein